MKQFRRVFSLLTAVILLITGFVQPLGMTISAKADAVSSQGSTEVADTPEELLAFGQWLYWVEDGMATIAGYSNPDETNLTIPAKLDGYPVTGIGAEAFRDNAALKTLQVPTNVTRIAANAFAGREDLTIRGYHGAYALMYAGQKGLNTQCINMAGVTFADGVLDLTGVPVNGYSELNDNGVIFNAKEATFLSVGQVVYFPKSASYPTGLAKRIASIIPSGDQLFVGFSQPEWSECFSSLIGEDELYVDWDHAVLAEGIELDETQAAASSFSRLYSVKQSLGKGATITGSLNIEIGKAKATYDVGMSGIFPAIKNANVKIPMTLTPSLEIKYEYSNTSRVVNRKTVPILKDIPILSAGGVLNGYFSVDLETEFSGELLVTTSIVVNVDISLQNGRIVNNTTTSKEDPTVQIEASLKIGPKLNAYIVLGWAGFSIRFFELGAGLYFRASGSGILAPLTNPRSSQAYYSCGDFDYSVKVELSVKIGIVKLAKFDFDKYWSIKPTFTVFSGHRHFESFRKVDSCTMTGRTVVYLVDGSTYATSKADVNSMLIQMSAPYKSGYHFDGWYVNAAASGLKGGDNLFDFASEAMPYCGTSGTLYLYAKFTKITHPVTGVSLNKSSVTAYTNDTAGTQLKAKVSPANADHPGVTWSSSNTNVVRVNSSGKVTYVGPGTATVTCRSVDNSSKYATCTFTIKQYAEKISVSGNLASVVVGDTMTLAASVSPSNTTNKAVTWSSSNTSVATVDSNGKVTAVAAGKTVITATAKDGSRVSGRYNLQVVAIPTGLTITVPVTGVTLEKTSATLYTVNKAGTTLACTVSPANADDPSLVWASSNESVATVDSNGLVKPIAGGSAVITCRSYTNPRQYASCTLTVIQSVEKITLSAFTSAIEIGDTLQLQASVQPAIAADKSVSWRSSDSGVATVSSSGLVTGKANGWVTITATAKDGSGVSGSIQLKVGQPIPIAVEKITLDTTTIEVYSNHEGDFQLTHTVAPENADDPSVKWFSSNTKVATVTQSGLVTSVGAGSATITCRSVSNPVIEATCAVTVKQYVEQVYVEGSVFSLLPDETTVLNPVVYPTNATNKTVAWTSSNEAVATVDASGRVTAVSPGDVTITATSTDGTKISGSYRLKVEKQLQLTVSMVSDTVYTQGSDSCTLAYVALTRPAAKRFSGQEITWTMTQKSGSGDTALVTFDSELDGGVTTSVAALNGTSFPTAGTEVYTVTCSVGGYTESVDVTVTVDGTAYAQTIKLTDAALGYNTVQMDVSAPVTIPGSPYSADDKPVPAGMTVTLKGDSFYEQFAQETMEADGVSVGFAESGIYTATARFEKGNLSYEAAATFNVADENGIVHLRVQSIELEDYFLNLVEGTTGTIEASVSPTDAYEKTLAYSSSDTTVAKVSTTGVVTALKPGTAVITCKAKDNSGVSAMCTVSVESYLQLDDRELAYTVYTGGQQHADLGTINVTMDSKARLLKDDRNVTWTLTRVSGSSTELGLSEYTAAAEEDISVSGNTIKLLRIYGAGTDEYRLTCTAGDYTDSCTIRVTAVQAELPASVELTGSSYAGMMHQEIPVSTAYTAQPSTAELPEDVTVTIDGGKAFWNAISPFYSFAEPEKLIFDKPGSYTATVTFSGSNYSYVCPICVDVADESGVVPVTITDLVLSESILNLSVGESRTVTASVLPANAQCSGITWQSTDSSVATVSSSGKVTAIGSGYATIIATAPESDFEGTCLVRVEEGINMVGSELERTVFVDGATRMTIDTVMLTENTSLRLTEAPEWTLRRVSGISLTLRAEPMQTVNADGDTLYGCNLMLYSVSKEGDTVYELTCTSGEDTATMRIVVHAVNRDRLLPATIVMKETVFTADMDELIVVRPELTVYPEESKLPNGILVSCEGGTQYQEALNPVDTYVSQSLSTFSFSKAGTYEANFVYAYSNVKYVIPVVFRIRDENGSVPVQASKMTLNHRNLNLVAGETAQLEAVFTPANATNQAVTWRTSDPSVVTVDASGSVKAIANGVAFIECIPADEECVTVSCPVTVEDYLTVTTGTTSRTLYVQGGQENTIATAMLSEGTIERIQADGITPVWKIETSKITHSTVTGSVREGDIGISVKTGALLSGGTDTYVISCTAGAYTWSQTYTLKVVDMGSKAPSSVTIAQKSVQADVNQAVTIDFTPIAKPTGTSMPEGMADLGYVGIGAFYDCMNWDYYQENGDEITVAFTKPGQYLVTRSYILANLQYVTACTITVGSEESGRNVLSATQTEYTVYQGGKSGVVSTVSLTDGMIGQLWSDEISWKATRISGSSLTVALKENGDSADVFVANVLGSGTDVWRISCTFGGMTEYVDITLTSAQPRGPLPEQIALPTDRLTGMIGNWITLPLGVTCTPSGTMLPDQGDDFWSFAFDQAGEERSESTIENGLLKVRFRMSGYYTGTLTYRSGNVSYAVPVYFEICDEEEEVKTPDLGMYIVNNFTTVYPEGETNIVIGQVLMAEGLSTYSTGAAVAYMNGANAVWKLTPSGTAATVRLEKVSDNVCNIVLSQMTGSGDVTYTVKCTVGGTTYSAKKTLHVAASSEERPDATLAQTSYQTVVGDELVISRSMYSCEDGSILQSSTAMDLSGLLAAVGYEVEESGDEWAMTFYQPGIYQSTVSAYVSNLKVETPITIRVVETSADISLTVLKLPAGLTTIDDEAFVGISANVVDMRGSNITQIGAGAFKQCVDLQQVYLPSGVTQIAEDAFYGCLNAVFYCKSGSYGAAWAQAHGFTVENP